MVAMGQRRENGELMFNEYSFSLGRENSSGDGGGDGYTTM